jgi:hypothetical protein
MIVAKTGKIVGRRHSDYARSVRIEDEIKHRIKRKRQSAGHSLADRARKSYRRILQKVRP